MSEKFAEEIANQYSEYDLAHEDMEENLVRIQQWRLERLGSSPGQRGEFIVNGETCVSSEEWHNHGPQGDDTLPTYSFLLFKEGEEDPTYIGYGRAEFENR